MLPVLILLAFALASLVWLRRHRDHRDRWWWGAWSVPVVAFAAIIWLVVIDLDLQRLIGRLLMPTGMVWISLIALSVAMLIARRWITGTLLVLLTLTYSLAGNVLLGSALVASLERRAGPLPVLEGLAPFEAVILLGGGTTTGPFGNPQLSAHGDRLALAAALWHRAQTVHIVAGGIPLGLDTGPHGDETVVVLARLGVPASAVVVVPEGRITRNEIAADAALVRERGWTRVGLITSAFHMPRALADCAREHLAVVPLPCDFLASDHPLRAHWLVPQASGFALVHLACWEWLGLLLRR